MSSPEQNRIEFEGKGGILHEPSEEEKKAWRLLFEQQLQLVFNSHDQISERFLWGLQELGFTAEFPDYQKLNEYLAKFGWRLDETNVVYMNKYEWFGAFEQGIFPTTWYIRELEDLDFTPYPDIFHDRFGHWPFLMSPDYMMMVTEFAGAYRQIMEEPDPQRRDVYITCLGQLWWHGITEFGAILEDGEIKICGPGLLSSKGELLHALSGEAEFIPFDLETLIIEPPAKAAYHERYFYFESVEQIRGILADFTRNIDVIIEGRPDLFLKILANL